jgi:hypothetical protein
MATAIETLEAELLKLAPAERARLLDRLVASLDRDAEVEAAWDEVADRREADLASGKIAVVSIESTLARLEARFPG